jgi:hypothetical protein
LAGGLNLYAYVGVNQVNAIDPTGLIKWSGTQKQASFIPGLGATFSAYEFTSVMY